MEDLFKERIGFKGELELISKQICEDFDLGNFKSNKLILMGYEDFNFILASTKGKYFVKVFANFRNLNDCNRYVTIMEKAVEAGVSIPKLYKSNQGYLHVMNIDGVELRLSVMQFIDGKTLLDISKNLTDDEIKFLAHQAALINSIDIKPEFIYDHWAVTSFTKEYEEKHQYLSDDYLKLLHPLLEKFKGLGIENLPHCFVHGDIIATNVMKDMDGKLWIIDFAVSNYYPRIQELAVLACNLLFDENNKEVSQSNLEIALEEYQKTIQLTEEELGALPIYLELAHAMHLLEANYEKVHNNNKLKENEYWLKQGLNGLKQNLV